MKYTDVLEFLQPDELQEKVKGIFEEEREYLKKRFSEMNVDIQQVGSSAVCGAIGKFDVDIQIRVLPQDFDFVVGFMHSYAHPRNINSVWTTEYALFSNKGDFIDYNVTVIGSKHDFFHKMRDYFITHPDELQRYNDLKLKHQGSIYEIYRPYRYAFLKEIRAKLPQ